MRKIEKLPAYFKRNYLSFARENAKSNKYILIPQRRFKEK